MKPNIIMVALVLIAGVLAIRKEIQEKQPDPFAGKSQIDTSLFPATPPVNPYPVPGEPLEAKEPTIESPAPELTAEEIVFGPADPADPEKDDDRQAVRPPDLRKPSSNYIGPGGYVEITEPPTSPTSPPAAAAPVAVAAPVEAAPEKETLVGRIFKGHRLRGSGDSSAKKKTSSRSSGSPP